MNRLTLRRENDPLLALGLELGLSSVVHLQRFRAIEAEHRRLETWLGDLLGHLMGLISYGQARSPAFHTFSCATVSPLAVASGVSRGGVRSAPADSAVTMWTDVVRPPAIDAASAVRLAELVEGLAVDDHGIAELSERGDQRLAKAFGVMAFHGGADQAARKMARVQFGRLFGLLGGPEDLLAEQHDHGVLERGHAGHHADLGLGVHGSVLSWAWSCLKVKRVPSADEAAR